MLAGICAHLFRDLRGIETEIVEHVGRTEPQGQIYDL
jgi:hypothetical protein